MKGERLAQIDDPPAFGAVRRTGQVHSGSKSVGISIFDRDSEWRRIVSHRFAPA